MSGSIRSERGGKPTERKCRWDFRHCVRLYAQWARVCVCGSARAFVCVCSSVCHVASHAPGASSSCPAGPLLPSPPSVGDTHPRGDQAHLAGCDMAVTGPWARALQQS